jgi:hypothetical protein
MTSYFRTLFEQNPSWVTEPSNDLVVARYRADNNLGADAEISKSVRQTIANVKSRLKKGPKVKGRRGRPPKALAAVGSRTGRGGLDQLEEMIDDTMSMARALDREGLGDVIRLLRSARNEVVWKSGQKA